MPAPMHILEGIKNFFAQYPHLAIPMLSAGVGAGTGALFSEEGAGGEGAARGALLGAGLGGAGALGMNIGTSAIRSALPNTNQALMTGALAGGGLGGIFGSTHPSPLKVERMRADEDERRARRKARMLAMEQEKRSSMKGEVTMAENTVVGPTGTQEKAAEADLVNAERLVAFEVGIEKFCKEAQITSDQLAQAAGVSRVDLVPATVNWLTAQLEAEKQAQAPAPAAK